MNDSADRNFSVNRPYGLEVFPHAQSQESTPLPPEAVDQPETPMTMLIRPKKRKKLRILFVFLILVILSGFLATASLAYTIAYEKIDIGNDNLQSQITQVVLSLPFMPKTPRYVLQSALLSLSETNSHGYDASLSISSESFISDFGVNSLDLKAVGNVDYRDTKNINFTADVDVTNQFRLLLRKLDHKVYMKLEEFPVLIASLFGIAETDAFSSLLDQWIEYDMTPLDSEARNLIEERSDSDSMTNEIATKTVENLLQEEVLSSIILTTVDYNGVEAYSLEYEPTPEQIDSLYTKLLASTTSETIYLDQPQITLSDLIEDLDIKIIISKADRLVRWVSVESEIKAEQDSAREMSTMIAPYVNDEQKYVLAFVLKLDNFNEEVVIEAPTDTKTFEEVTQELFSVWAESTTNGSGYNVGYQFEQARDTQRRSDLYQITTAIYQYASEHNGFLPDEDNDPETDDFPTDPTCIGAAPQCWNPSLAGIETGDTIVPTYIDNIPLDPSVGHAQNTGYTIYKNSLGRIVASAPGAELSEITLVR